MSAQTIINLSYFLKKYIEIVGKAGSFFILPLIFVTIWDVAMRKMGGAQYWLVTNFGDIFGSTKIQEWEWHFHTMLFTMVLGYGFIMNRHIRVDLVRERLSVRKQAWIEFLGTTFFMLPFCAVVGFFAFVNAVDSFNIGEISASTVGLCCRWAIRSFLVVGLLIAGFSGIAVWLQTVVVLFGPKELRFPLMTLQWPEEEQKRTRIN